MNAQQYQRVTEIFDAALRLQPDQRDSYLADECRNDPDVARAVQRMLAQHDAPAFDLDSSAMGAGLDMAGLVPATSNGADSGMPRRIGAYEVVGVLGEGGMSIVYRARQDFPRREVALKVLRGGAMSPAAMRRFRAEIETLAKLSHPNIAQVYQAGSQDDGERGTSNSVGRPYFAMELVEGLTLTEYARKHDLKVAERLRLMIDVCRAVQHAHLRGVIHRDLKPGNILVAQRDEETERRTDEVQSRGVVGPTSSLHLSASQSLPIPKVLDFGIARATDHDVTRATLAAETGQIIGTLPYMSPEQLSGDTATIDLRSDVYALGVVLFELLAGQLPHAISGDMSLPQTAQALARSEPRRLGEVDRSLRGELEVIASAAMERERERRYQSADALADDLQAYLDHRPIRAKPPGPILRARKWLRRHPTSAMAAAIVALSLVAIAFLVVLQQHRAQKAAAHDLAMLMDTARREVDAYAGDLDASRRREMELLEVHNQLYRYNPPAQALELEQRERRLLEARNDHEAALHRIIDLLARAQRQGAPEDEIRRMQARVYYARMREAETAGDRFARSTYHLLARQHDPDGRVAGEMLERFPLAVRSNPPAAEAHLFRLIEQSEFMSEGEPRLVPVPFKRSGTGTSPSVVPESLLGRFSLRIVDGRGVLNDDDIVLSVAGAEDLRDNVFVRAAAPAHGLRPLDRLVSVDSREVHSVYDAYPPLPGVNAAAAPAQRTYVFERTDAESSSSPQVTVTGASLEALGIRVGDAAQALGESGGVAQVWRRGERVTMTLPPGITFRVTAKPMLVSDESLIGVTPIAEPPIPVERGRYILLLLKDGCEPLRIPLDIHEGGMIDTMSKTTWNMLPRGSTPPGFVRVCQWVVPGAEPYWIMEREVAFSEYLEFLNDPEILARIDASPTPILYPRSGSFMECGRQTDGLRLFTTGAEMRPDDPVLAVTWNDAIEYVRWRNRRAHARGEIPDDMHYDLPTHMEWLAAWGSIDRNEYPWGSHFRPTWASSNYARQQPAPEPGMRFPIDETDTGVFDMAGCMSEWLNAWWIEERNQREVTGGSWGHGGGFNYSDMFMLYGQNGQTATVTNGTVGFRLVLRKGAAP